MINKVKINPIDRINRIAMTGDIEDPKPLSPVDNIMQHYPKAQETPQEEGGFWNGLKNFAGSKGGRMLIGGLGTAAAVGLTGGGLQNALGYGVIGAGKTAENIYQKEQDQKAWEEKEAERLFRQQENLDNRKFQAQMKMAEIEAQKDARNDAFENAKTMLGLNKDNAIKTEIEKLTAINDYKKEQILANPTLSDEQKQFAIGRLNSDFDYDAYYTDKYYNGTPEQRAEAEQYLARKTSYNNLVNPWDNLLKGSDVAHKGGVAINPEAANEGRLEFVAKPQKLSDAQFAYQEALKRGEDPLTAARTSGLDQFYNNEFELKKAIAVETEKHQNEMEKQNDAQAHDVNMVDVKAKADEEKAKRDFERSLAKSEYDNELKKGFEAYKKTLPVNKVIELEQKAALMNEAGFNVTAGDLALEDYLNDVASRNKTNAQTGYTNAQTDFVTGAKTDLTNAQINNVNARTGLTEAQTGQVGKTSGINNAEWLANNPNATMEQKIALGISGSYGKAYNDAIMTGKTPEQANEIAMAKVQEDILTGQIMSGMFGGMPTGQVGGNAPVYPAEDGEDPLNLMK